MNDEGGDASGIAFDGRWIGRAVACEAEGEAGAARANGCCDALEAPAGGVADACDEGTGARACVVGDCGRGVGIADAQGEGEGRSVAVGRGARVDVDGIGAGPGIGGRRTAVPAVGALEGGGGALNEGCGADGGERDSGSVDGRAAEGFEGSEVRRGREVERLLTGGDAELTGAASHPSRGAGLERARLQELEPSDGQRQVARLGDGRAEGGGCRGHEGRRLLGGGEKGREAEAIGIGAGLGPVEAGGLQTLFEDRGERGIGLGSGLGDDDDRDCGGGVAIADHGGESWAVRGADDGDPAGGESAEGDGLEGASGAWRGGGRGSARDEAGGSEERDARAPSKELTGRAGCHPHSAGSR